MGIVGITQIGAGVIAVLSEDCFFSVDGRVTENFEIFFPRLELNAIVFDY